MDHDFAEELKQRGNEAYAAKRYEDALVLYERALEANPDSFVYHNNCAAAYHELKKYDKAIESARKSIAIRDNAKAHLRIGSALWAQRKYTEARGEFEHALGLEPGNASATDSIAKLQRILQPQSAPRGAASPNSAGATPQMYATTNGVNLPLPRFGGGEFTSQDTGNVGLIVDCVVAVLGAMCVLSSFVAPRLSVRVWPLLLLATCCQQILVMRALNLIQFSSEMLTIIPRNFCTCLLTLCVMAFVTGVAPVTFMAAFIAVYSVADLINKRASVEHAIGGSLYASTVGPIFEQLEAKKLSLLLMAASIESILIFTIMLTGGTMFTLVYTQYGKIRYQRDSFMQLACTALRTNITRLTRSRFVPAMVDLYAQKFFDVLYMLSQQGMD